MNAFYLRSPSGDPFYNLAVEEYILDHFPENKPVLLLWQSDNAVVIGRHQNPWKETDGGFIMRKRIALARRISGGGAVYHDRGNLNFSFIADRRFFDPDRQIRAVREILVPHGIRATIGKRRDLYVAGKKFSGSAYAFRRDRALHHGTLLVNADLSMMRALEGKMRITNQQGTLSEHSAVINLKSVNPDISIEGVARSLRIMAEKITGCRFLSAEISDLCDSAVLSALHDKQRSWDWRYGNTPAFDAELGAAGGRISVHVDRGRVGAVRSLPDGKMVLDAGRAVRFHRDDIPDALADAGDPRGSLIRDHLF